MRLKPVFFDLFLLTLTVPVVILLFKVIPDRTTAAFYAGVLFVSVPIVMMLQHRRLNFANGAEWIWWGGVLFFWALFALPIFILRLSSGTVPFAELSILGVPAPAWHSGANVAYIVMFGAVLLAGWMGGPRTKRRK